MISRTALFRLAILSCSVCLFLSGCKQFRTTARIEPKYVSQRINYQGVISNISPQALPIAGKKVWILVQTHPALEPMVFSQTSIYLQRAGYRVAESEKIKEVLEFNKLNASMEFQSGLNTGFVNGAMAKGFWSPADLLVIVQLKCLADSSVIPGEVGYYHSNGIDLRCIDPARQDIQWEVSIAFAQAKSPLSRAAMASEVMDRLRFETERLFRISNSNS